MELTLNDGVTIKIHESRSDGMSPSEYSYKFLIEGTQTERSGFGELRFDTFSSDMDRMRVLDIPEYISHELPVGVPFCNVTVFYPNGSNEQTEQRMRAGAGSAMYEKMIRRAHAENARFIITGTASESAQQFWKKMGFASPDGYWFIKTL